MEVVSSVLVERHFDGLLGRVAVSSEAGLLVGTHAPSGTTVCTVLPLASNAPWPADWQQRVASVNRRCVGGVAVVGVYSFYRDAAAASQQFAAALPALAAQLHRDSARASRLDAPLTCAVALAVSVKTPRIRAKVVVADGGTESVRASKCRFSEVRSDLHVCTCRVSPNLRVVVPPGDGATRARALEEAAAKWAAGLRDASLAVVNGRPAANASLLRAVCKSPGRLAGRAAFNQVQLFTSGPAISGSGTASDPSSRMVTLQGTVEAVAVLHGAATVGEVVACLAADAAAAVCGAQVPAVAASVPAGTSSVQATPLAPRAVAPLAALCGTPEASGAGAVLGAVVALPGADLSDAALTSALGSPCDGVAERCVMLAPAPATKAAVHAAASGAADKQATEAVRVDALTADARSVMWSAAPRVSGVSASGQGTGASIGAGGGAGAGADTSDGQTAAVDAPGGVTVDWGIEVVSGGDDDDDDDSGGNGATARGADDAAPPVADVSQQQASGASNGAVGAQVAAAAPASPQANAAGDAGAGSGTDADTGAGTGAGAGAGAAAKSKPTAGPGVPVVLALGGALLAAAAAMWAMSGDDVE